MSSFHTSHAFYPPINRFRIKFIAIQTIIIVIIFRISSGDICGNVFDQKEHSGEIWGSCVTGIEALFENVGSCQWEHPGKEFIVGVSLTAPFFPWFSNCIFVISLAKKSELLKLLGQVAIYQ